MIVALIAMATLSTEIQDNVQQFRTIAEQIFLRAGAGSIQSTFRSNPESAILSSWGFVSDSNVTAYIRTCDARLLLYKAGRSNGERNGTYQLEGSNEAVTIAEEWVEYLSPPKAMVLLRAEYCRDGGKIQYGDSSGMALAVVHFQNQPFGYPNHSMDLRIEISLDPYDGKLLKIRQTWNSEPEQPEVNVDRRQAEQIARSAAAERQLTVGDVEQYSLGYDLFCDGWDPNQDTLRSQLPKRLVLEHQFRFDSGGKHWVVVSVNARSGQINGGGIFEKWIPNG